MTVVHVLGTHGVPAAYGGFETAAQEVGLFLRDRGWEVIVYCQLPGEGPTTQDQWHGLTRVLIHEPREGWRGTAAFDLTCVRHVVAHAGPDDVCLTFGYNTGIFNVAQRVRGIPNVINMDGMEWTRRRWGLLRQGILLGNERMAGLVGDVLIADHPVISDYLRRHFGSSRVATITYGAHTVDDAPTGPVDELGLTPGEFATMICRPIPENSLPRDRAGLVSTYPGCAPRRARRLPARRPLPPCGAVRGRRRGALPGGRARPARRGLAATALRVYLHGHTVGGTNPSLVEAMAAGNAVVARRNVYNTWVAGEGALYFSDEDELDGQLAAALDPDEARRLGKLARERFEGEFTWERIGTQYEEALLRAMDRRGRRREARTPR